MQVIGEVQADRLIAQLEATYDDPELLEQAAQKLNTLRQSSKSFSSFLAEFDHTLLEVKGMS